MTFIMFWLLPSLLALLIMFMINRFEGTTPSELERDDAKYIVVAAILWPLAFVAFFIVLAGPFLLKERSLRKEQDDETVL